MSPGLWSRCTVEAVCSIAASIKMQVETRHCLLIIFLIISLLLAYMSRLWLFLFNFAVVFAAWFQ